MRRILVRLGVAIATFSFGVSVTAVYWLCSLPGVIELELPVRSQDFPGRAVKIQKSSPSSAYFAGVSLSDNAWSNQFRVEWYSEHLRAMNEPALPSLVNDWE